MATIGYTLQTDEHGNMSVDFDPPLEVVASDPATSSDLLRSLARTHAPLVAANPNTPEDVIWRLAERYPAEVCQNPVLPLLFLVNPDLMIHPFTLEILARCPECPDYLQQRFQAMDQPTFGKLLLTWRAKLAGKKLPRFFGEQFVYGQVGMACHHHVFGSRQLAWRYQIATGLESPIPFLKRLAKPRRLNDKTDEYRDGILIGADRVLAVLERMGCVQHTLFNMY